MKQSMRKTTAFIFALTLAATPLTFNALPVYADEAVTEQTVTASGEVTQEEIEKNIIGTWIMAETDGQAALTNDKSVFTIVSPTEAYSSVSRVNDRRSPWHSPSQCDISVDGSIVTITINTKRGTTIEHQFTITEISADKFTANRVFTRSSENGDPKVTEDVVTFIKVDDLSEAVNGTWEGKCTSAGSVFDDGKEHRWEYKPDGTYVYYSKVGDEWVASDNSENEYFVAGNLLCMRWVDNGTENREWWEISVEDGHMSWTALRANEDGSTFTATFEMDKVGESTAEVTQEDIEENIIGTWITAEKEGDPALTNEKSVFTIVSPTEAYSSVSRVNDRRSPWHSPSQHDISIDGNVVTITIITERGRTIEHQFTITEISADKFTANRKFTRSSQDGEPQITEDVVTFVKVDDLSEAALGTWEGRCTSESSVFDDGKEHRWEYKPDGTYVYYNKVGDEWVADDSGDSEYFVAGNLLCTRWTKDGTENREWWEISVDDGHMSWTALRADEDGSTYTATFEMDKVEENTVEAAQEQTVETTADTPTTTTNPKTGMSGGQTSAGLAAIMTLAGVALVKTRRKEDKD